MYQVAIDSAPVEGGGAQPRVPVARISVVLPETTIEHVVRREQLSVIDAEVRDGVLGRFRLEKRQGIADGGIERLGKLVGKERLLGGTECGFDTFIRFSQVDPDVAWLKLKSLSEGAELASAEL